MRFDPRQLPDPVLAFLIDRQLATLTTLHADGRPHVVPVGFTFDASTGLARVITDGASVKAGNAARGGRAVLCQVDRGRWLSVEGVASVDRDPSAVADAEARYAVRYRVPRVNPARVVLLVAVDRITGRV